MKTRFKAVIFDCDGLLLDTEDAHTVGERDLCARYGRTYGDDKKRLLLGSSFEAAGRIFESLLDQPSRATELRTALGAEAVPIAQLSGRLDR